MSAIEMSSAARAGLPVKFFVLDDGAYHYMQMLQEPVYRRTTATEIARIDYAAFAQGVGLALQPDRRQRGRARRPCTAAIGMPGPVLTRRCDQLRGARDPLAQRRAVALHQRNCPVVRKSGWRADRRAEPSTPKPDSD